ncbi:MAG: right-handed parallel beta-helix repeat-containing protein, partial [Planctomycetota bacterium]|nr:right-handed parallel beta-helix repeat-containing protein [Planctomycetota bacterium]
TLTNSYEFADGDIVTLTTTGTLPAPLLASTNYYVILTAVSKTYKLAANKQNAMIGSQIDITDAGSGTHTLTRYATFFVGQGNKFNGGKGTLQNVTGGVTLHEYTGYIGTDKNQDLIGFGDIIPYWTQGHTQKRMIGGGTGTKLTFKFKQLSGGQPRITFYVVWNGRNDNNPRGGFFTLAFGTYDDFDVNPISDQMGTVITIAAVAYDGSGYPYWDVTFPVNASLWYMVQASGESADSSVLEISQS